MLGPAVGARPTLAVEDDDRRARFRCIETDLSQSLEADPMAEKELGDRESRLDHASRCQRSSDLAARQRGVERQQVQPERQAEARGLVGGVGGIDRLGQPWQAQEDQASQPHPHRSGAGAPGRPFVSEQPRQQPEAERREPQGVLGVEHEVVELEEDRLRRAMDQDSMSPEGEDGQRGGQEPDAGAIEPIGCLVPHACLLIIPISRLSSCSNDQDCTAALTKSPGRYAGNDLLPPPATPALGRSAPARRSSPGLGAHGRAHLPRGRYVSTVLTLKPRRLSSAVR